MKKQYNYFDAFIHLVGYSCQAAELLHDVLRNYDPTQIEAQIKKMHKIEHTADQGKHELMNHLVKEFITPIEREDIMSIIHEIDEVTDIIEDVLMKIYVFNIQSIRPEALELTKIIVDCCNALKVAFKDFHNFKRSAAVKTTIIEVNRLEEIADEMSTKFIRNLYVTSKDAVELMVWTQTFELLEGCCDQCEDVANVMEEVIMKNT